MNLTFKGCLRVKFDTPVLYRCMTGANYAHINKWEAYVSLCCVHLNSSIPGIHNNYTICRVLLTYVMIEVHNVYTEVSQTGYIGIFLNMCELNLCNDCITDIGVNSVSLLFDRVK